MIYNLTYELSNSLCRTSISYRSSIPRSKQTVDRTSSEFQKRVDALPENAVINALAEIANDPRLLKNEMDLLNMRITELLYIGGFRIGELLTLPCNTLVREPVLDESGTPVVNKETGKPSERIGLRYWPEKGGEPVVKWMPTLTIPILLRALNDINRICGPARINAEWLEAHPGEVNLSASDNERLTRPRVQEILEFARPQYVRAWFKTRGEKFKHRKTTVATLRRLLVAQRYEEPVLIRGNGHVQRLSKSLFAIFLNQSNPHNNTNRFISVPMRSNTIQTFLCGGDGSKSIFERFEHISDDGKPFRIKTHDFRRLLNMVAQWDLSQVEIARWMGRRRIADNAAYDLRTAVDMADEMRELVSKNAVYGVIADQVEGLPRPERASFLKDRLAMIHTTPHGQCASNLAETPCATALSCLGGCRNYLRKKGDQKSRKTLLLLESETLIALERARVAASEGKHNAENWIKGQETVLRTVRAALAIDDDNTLSDGEAHRVTPDGENRGEPL